MHESEAFACNAWSQFVSKYYDASCMLMSTNINNNVIDRFIEYPPSARKRALDARLKRSDDEEENI